ncbi:GMC oxidoreductase-domain-containing protein [Pseudomassariella vexata]|uniref:GMC oxidoreductase-domain-containing protein n=1 Tax=Pseudomassariella vexata TaxID=1141098 RepID=A0A1Y2ELL8_9PEZI|nr:GMC oxidoreductase-domain-containing protein [Pseudomassariella vexata]ORY72166.1 GMC oxidoreductase-domain-containing protein [Pseudomassariella vexata]
MDVVRDIVLGDEYWSGVDVDTDEEILDVIRDSLMNLWHVPGTCKMGKEDDSRAVINSDTKVFGVGGLRAVDGDSFPILPTGHPQSSIYALAERLLMTSSTGVGKCRNISIVSYY